MTHAALFGVNPWKLQAWLGHKRIEGTMRYVHKQLGPRGGQIRATADRYAGVSWSASAHHVYAIRCTRIMARDFPSSS